VVLGLPALATDASGTGSRSVRFGRAAGIRLWTHAAQGGIAFRLANGPEGHCGLLTSAVATRLRIPQLGIDLPVVLQPGQAFPLCNVAMYLPAFSQPGEAGPTFLYAHARTGMFLPLLQASWLNNGRAMIGMPVTVWTTDDRVVTYRVTRVLRHVYRVPDYDPSQAQLWLQTSEGPYGTYHKLFVTAVPVSERVASYADAHPTPHPVVCGYYH
jgi:sortase (surface protein transpeptidase)